METQILLAGDLDLIEKGEMGTTKKDIAANRKNVKSADKVFRKQTLESLNPGILEPSSPTKLEKNYKRGPQIAARFLTHLEDLSIS